jgi:L-alanine-DL-glutamate epimerase-like enolase superfamily enzyme
MMGAIPNAGPHVEFTIEQGSWWEGFYRPLPVVIEGKVEIPIGPGWGVEINPAWLAQVEHQVSELA